MGLGLGSARLRVPDMLVAYLGRATLAQSMPGPRRSQVPVRPSQSFKLLSQHMKGLMCKAILLLISARPFPVEGLSEKLKAEPRVARVGLLVPYQSYLLSLDQPPAFFPLPLEEVHLFQRQGPGEAPPGVKGQLPTLHLCLRPTLLPIFNGSPWPPPALEPILTRGLLCTPTGTFLWRLLFLLLFFHLWDPWKK